MGPEGTNYQIWATQHCSRTGDTANASEDIVEEEIQEEVKEEEEVVEEETVQEEVKEEVKESNSQVCTLNLTKVHNQN